MNWTSIWELIKINILYSNPQALTALKKKQEKRPSKNFKAYKSIIKQQITTSILFLFIYLFMFIGIDFSKYPGYFSFYIALFFVMSTLTAFSSLYTIFYDSNDLALYVHLPIKSGELYLAKVFSSLGMGSVFLMPLVSLFILAYWQIMGNPLAIPLALLLFLLVLVSSYVLALYLNSWIGKIIVRSPRRKLISTILMFISTFGAIALVLLLNFNNQSRMNEEHTLIDRSPLPYFRGYYDVVHEPFSAESLLHFWLPLLVVILLLFGIVKLMMPKYFEEALYTSAKTSSAKPTKKKVRTYSEQSLDKVMVRHHLSTLQNATLLTQTYLMPLIYIFSFMAPAISKGQAIADFVGNEYFGLTFLVGILLASISMSPSTFVGVATSLEKENFIYLKSLPFSMERFLKEKFLLFIALQTIGPALLYSLLLIFVLKLALIPTLSFLIGYILMSLVQGQFMFRRDLKYLNLRWQDMTQLFTRGGGQWYTLGLIFGTLIAGLILVGITIFSAIVLKEVLLVNGFLVFILLVSLAVAQYFLIRNFWKKIYDFLVEVQS
ncbi:ABC transporter permease [Streptococcus catagoni]|uniref:ABC transporter permease n=1 Tax=Streptococcus catagoni TaxID=2654874 RepID=UPI00140D6E9A|nr:ABC transporter permease [Streptococcus catagoni]